MKAEGKTMIHGECDPKFQSVADQFEKNFAEKGEVGASLSLTLEGETVVDLWGGMADPETETPWEKDTVSIVYSCTKGATALCAHLLVERGQLELDAPVIQYWPEFGKHGKEAITVAMMLNHSAGLPTFREPLKKDAYYDWDYMIHRLEEEAPFWEPGTRNGYHMTNFGWTVGELVRRASGKSLGRFFQDEVADPLQIDFWIGLPKEIEPRVAPILFPPLEKMPNTAFAQALRENRSSIPALAFFNCGGHRGKHNTRQAHAAELGAGGGITNARAQAKMYAPLANEGHAQGVSLLKPETILRMSQVSMATQQDATLLIPTRFALGFMKSMDNRKRAYGEIESVILSEQAFGHVGAGGSIGFADPDCRMSFSYTMNQMGHGILLNPRGQSVIDAAYDSLGYRSNASGVWSR